MGDPSPPDPAQPDPAQPAQPEPAAAVSAGTGAATPGPGGGGDKPGISGPLIGAGGIVVAAIIAGVFGLIVALHNPGRGGGGGGSTAQPSTSVPQTSAPPAQAGVNIQGEQWFAPVNGIRVIRVSGTAQSFPPGEVIWVMAGRHEGIGRYWGGGPATVSSQGTWAADIKKVPATVLTLTFWWSQSPKTTGGACFGACAAALNAKDLKRIAIAGPHAAFLTRVGPPVVGHAPGH